MDAGVDGMVVGRRSLGWRGRVAIAYNVGATDCVCCFLS